MNISRGQHFKLLHLALVVIAIGLTACAGHQYPYVPAQSQTQAPEFAGATTSNHPGLLIAQQQIGTPYRYGGATPRGFDCSGLVYYSYRKAGFSVPRTSLAQYTQSQQVDLDQLSPGDLVFFRLTGKKLSHVGIYEGNGRFLHAPSSGKRVSYASLKQPYWRSRMIGVGRFVQPE